VIPNAKIGGISNSKYNWFCNSQTAAVFQIIPYINIAKAKLNVFHTSDDAL
jgi:hypothetical protein